MSRSRWVLMLCLLGAALAAGCGGNGDSKSAGGGGGANGASAGGGNCKDADKALTDAARGHVAPLKVATDGAAGEGEVDRITVEVCRTTEEDATAVVVVFGMRDKLIRDVRHQLRLIKVGGLWQVTNDQDSQRCQKGKGPQEFSPDICQ